MFRKIVTELAYSPALAGSLSQYVKQLRDETSKRQIGLIFTLLAVTVQVIATLYPPESANANNPAVFFDKEIESIEQYLDLYDENTANIKDLLRSLGVTRNEIKSASLNDIPSSDTITLWTTNNPRTSDTNMHFFTTSNQNEEIAYYRPFPQEVEGSNAFIGTSTALGGWFGITKQGANLITEHPLKQKCIEPLQVHSWSKNDSCLKNINQTLRAHIIPSNTEIRTLKALDRVAYTLSIENKSDSDITIVPSINLVDTLEYSRILDYGGGSYNFDSRNLRWKSTKIPANSSIDRTFIIQMLPSIPATATGQHIPSSYDCVLDISFGTSLTTPVDCPISKRVEQFINQLPRVPRSINILGASLLILTVGFLYIRSRQMLTELYIIRHNHLGGL